MQYHNILLKAFLIFPQVQEGVLMIVDLEKMHSIEPYAYSDY